MHDGARSFGQRLLVVLCSARGGGDSAPALRLLRMLDKLMWCRDAWACARHRGASRHSPGRGGLPTVLFCSASPARVCG